MAEITSGDGSGDGPSGHHRILIRNMQLAAARLAAPSKLLFERLYLRGENDEVVRRDMNIPVADFKNQKSALLRTLMIATTT